jgi:2-oxoglutarate dehydrogenase E2 component (dihydrolipoamide succinyltransferase)
LRLFQHERFFLYSLLQNRISPLNQTTKTCSLMAKIDVVMPKMGESLMEGTIIEWLKKVGDPIQKDENLLRIATDKVDTDVPAPESGIVAEILYPENTTVAVGLPIARIETEVGAVVTSSTPEPAPTASAAPMPNSRTDTQGAPSSDSPSAPVHGNGQTISVSAAPPASGGRFYSPVVMQIAQAEGISMQELERIPGSGIGGRVTKSDVLNYLKSGRVVATPSALPKAAPAATRQPEPAPPVLTAPPHTTPVAPAPPKPASVSYDASRSEVIQMDNMRRLIAEHMVRSKQTSAHVTSVSEADVTGLVRLVKAKKAAFESANGIKLTYTPFFIDAVVKTLKQFPMVNASVDGDKIILKKYINIGVAVALGERGEGGLIVPVIKGADEKNIVGLARAVQDLASRARSKKLLPDEIQGGTFTITNYGTSGNLFGAPIINQPQVAILGTGAIVKRPVVKTMPDDSDVIVIRSMMYVSLSYDHRIIDGALAGFFLQSLVAQLESYNEHTPL